MIIQNGYIQFKHKNGGGLDASGYPVKATETWGNPIPCQYVPRSFSYVKRAGENTKVEASYEAYVETPLRGATEQLMLTDMLGAQIGVYSLVSSQELQAVRQIKLIF